MRKFKTIGLWIGVILGLGAPLGAVLFKSLLFGQLTLEWISAEITTQRYYYVYMACVTPVVFALFGACLGGLSDVIQSQKESLQKLKNFLETQSMTDDVTGVYNHRHLLEEIEKEVERSKRHNHFLSGMMIDVDGFKEINESYGHLVGDSVLREMAIVLADSIRKIDIFGRYGGDEFVVILPEAQLPAAEVVAERILKNVRKHRFKTQRDDLSMTVSIGLFSFEDTRDLDKTQFIEKIDQAMFRAKGLGKDATFAVS